MSHEAIVKFAPVWLADRFDDPTWNRPGRTLYQRGAFQFLPGKSTVPLLVDHDDDREVGTVHELFELDWIDGPWIAARATVTDPPVWLKRGETKASFGSKTYDRREIDIRGTSADIVAKAFVEEVSVLSPSVKPAEPRAEVWSYRLAEPAVRSPAVPDRAVVGDTYEDDYRPAMFEELERKLGRRVDWDNYEAALATYRRPLDALYEEHMAAKRRPQPGVIIRPGIGQVLGVR
jgi:hypothetical protein